MAGIKYCPAPRRLRVVAPSTAGVAKRRWARSRSAASSPLAPVPPGRRGPWTSSRIPSGVISATSTCDGSRRASASFARLRSASGGTHSDAMAGAVRSPVERFTTTLVTTLSLGTITSRPSPVLM